MDDGMYRVDWARPISPNFAGERSYHATDGRFHILVIATDDQVLLAARSAAEKRGEDPDFLAQNVLEEAIARAIKIRPPTGGELRLRDTDFE